MIGNNYLLWENDEYIVKTPFNPHIPYSEGLQVIVATKADQQTAWEDPQTASKAFEIAAQVCKIAEELQLAPWFNIQANGNWGLLPGATPFFHIHIYGRNKTSNWGKPLVLPEAPKTYNNESMPQEDRKKLTEALGTHLHI